MSIDLSIDVNDANLLLFEALNCTSSASEQKSACFALSPWITENPQKQMNNKLLVSDRIDANVVGSIHECVLTFTTLQNKI